MFLAIMSASVPGLHARFHRGEPDAQITALERAESQVSVEKISPPRHLHSTIPRIPEGWTRISLDRLTRPEPASIDETLGRTKRQSERNSWRVAMSDVGLAV